ncbi:MAG TPA: hypothetical protein VLD37_03670 [Candidatus Bilamarchaeum sp.]|nr:hypothetical protein [Candidatus Bilamarchaeum sp.]
MRITHTQLAHFSHTFRWFSVSPMDPDRIRSGAHTFINSLDSENAGERCYAVKALGLACFLELGAPNDVSGRLLRLFEHYAQFSGHEDVRMGCLDAIYLASDLPRLKSLTFETGCLPTDHYRQHLASQLRKELYPPVKC